MISALRQFAITTDLTARPRIEKAEPNKRVKWRFLKGPVPWGWLCQACNLTKKSPQVAIGLCFISGMQKNRTVKMQKKVLRDLGVSRHAFYRARDKMEAAGLISVKKRPGQSPLITLQFNGVNEPQGTSTIKSEDPNLIL